MVAGHQVAARGQSECLLSVSVGSEEAVDRLVKGARHAGAKVLTEPGHKPWGYAGTFRRPRRARLDGDRGVPAGLTPSSTSRHGHLTCGGCRGLLVSPGLLLVVGLDRGWHRWFDRLDPPIGPYRIVTGS